MNPLSAAFGAGVALRNFCYGHGVFKSRKLARPVISVGNISVGGSGKTPFVIALGQLLRDRGIEFDVLSRGYGRSSGEAAVVHPEGRPEQFGDEPLLIARRLHVPVIVGASRYSAGLLAERQFNSKLHLLDDGFQHRRLHRDFEIVLLQSADLDDTLLPVGRLREPLASLARADAVVLPESMELPSVSTPAWRITRELSLPAGAPKAVAFCGIARPQQFFAMLQTAGVKLAATFAFHDHQRYGEREIQQLQTAKQETKADVLITTEKDAINLGELSRRLEPLQVATLQLRLQDPQAALEMLLKTLNQRCGCGF